MRFVHLAPRSAVAGIRRNGLRLGDGRRGRGVYAVPLFRIRRSRPRAPDDADDDAVDISVPLTSGTVWRHTLGRLRAPRSRPVAVVFALPRRCWPIDVFLEVAPLGAERLLEDLHDALSDDLAVTADDLAFVRRASRDGVCSDLKATIATGAALGKLLHLYVEYGARVWSRYDDQIEVVIRSPIPASAIESLRPLSRTNRTAKRRAIGARSASDRDEDDGEPD
jgi:hypothetical protein